MRALDRVLPEYDHAEAYQIAVEVDPKTAMAAFLATPAAPDRVVRAMLRLRGLRAGPTVEALLTGTGFAVLHRSPTELVVAAAGRPWTPRGGMRPAAEARAGEVLIAVDVRAAPLREGRSTLSTETRIAAADAGAARAFRRYWSLVRPFSGLVRRRWLQAAKSSAEGHSRRPPG